ncbi:LysR family transcriptional regulator [Amycolatopsis jejuensis]|uniref:LysR family transcriptional regulator n=1 Tax=Amycolatopsis jejuensis TaxID=330084 RepID=UPI000A9A3AA8|nr:LysR family transcriptional regulator [Amycolatopsis jejuensis]
MQPAIELRHLRYFTAVVEERTFTAAAERLRMTQPALSRAIRALEKEFGSALLRRGRAGVELTVAGEVLFREAKSLDESVTAAFTRARRAAESGRQLRVSARGCDVATLMQLVAGYRECGVAPMVADRSVQLTEVRQGAVDVTLVRAPFDRRGLDSEHLRTDRRVLLVPRTHRLARCTTVDRRELDVEAFPVWSNASNAELSWWAGAESGDRTWRRGPVVHDSAQFLAAVRLGQAVALLPETMLGEASLSGIAVVEVSGVSGSELHLAWAKDATSPDLAAFVRHATNPAHRAALTSPMVREGNHQAS